MLNKITVPLSLNQGLDTKTDPKQTVAGKLLELENGIFTNIGKISKRSGYIPLSNELVASGTITTGLAINTFKNEILLCDGERTYTYSNDTQKWSPRGNLQSILIRNLPIIRNDYQQTSVDSNSIRGIEVFAWEDSRGGVRYSICDTDTGSFIVQDQLLASFGTNPKVIRFSSEILVFYTVSGALNYRRITTSNPTLLGAEQVVASTVSIMNAHFDCAVVGNRLFIAFNTSSSSTSALYLESNFIASTAQTVSGGATNCISIHGDSQQRVWIARATATEVRVYCRTYALNLALSDTLLDTRSDVARITGIETNSTTFTQQFIYEITSGTTYNTLLYANTIIGTTIGSPFVFKRSVGLASKLFNVGNNKFVNVAFQGGLQDTYFMLNLNGDIVSKANYGTAGGLLLKSNLPEVHTQDAQHYKYANLVKGRLQSQNNTIFTITGVNSTEIGFGEATNFLSSELGDNLLTVGGIVQSYDGVSYTEHGFLLFPHNIVTQSTATTGGFISDGTYFYSVCYEWTDNQGQIHRSAPSIPISVTLSGGTTTQTQILRIPTLRLTNKVSPRSDARIVIYRTENNGTLYYRTSSIISPVFNDTTVDYVDFTDTTSNTNLVSNELLYTTGGVLENIAPPSCQFITSFKNRIFLAGLEDDNAFWYSKLNFSGEPVQFSDSFVGKVDAIGGPITAMAPLDDKLIIFKKSSIFVLIGQGPNDAGGDNDYLEPELIVTDTGCSTPNSVVTTPVGLMFKSAKGIYLLDRSLQVTYIGAMVERYNYLTITSSVLVANTNQVRFTTNTDVVLVFDYFYQQWSTFTNIQAVDSIIWQDAYLFLTTQGQVLKEDSSVFTDASKPYSLKITTSWLSFAGLQNFQRVYRLLLLGEYEGYHKLRVRFAYDFSDFYTQETLIDLGTVIQETTFGSVSPYGQEAVFGGEDPLYQFRIHLSQQKCESIKISIEDSQASDFNAGYSLSALNFEVGAKQGQNKLASKRSFGSS